LLLQDRARGRRAIECQRTSVERGFDAAVVGTGSMAVEVDHKPDARMPADA
jgi:hypothetical protein